MKALSFISALCVSLMLLACTGSKKYFKAAERMEKQGLVNEAAEFYFQSLQRKPTNVEARIKLKEVGQKYTGSLASEFFRNYNTQQYEASLGSYERMKDFVDRCNALQVQLDYPKAYDEDYQAAVETWCSKNHHQASLLVNQKKYIEAQSYISKVNRYNKGYKNIAQLTVVATCEPLYQSAISSLENKNYNSALQALASINQTSDNYKDARELLNLATAKSSKTFILFEPKGDNTTLNRLVEDYLFTSFNQAALEKLNNVKVINNSPFQQSTASFDASKSANVDLIQAIRKATGADYFYFYNVSNAKEYDSGLNKTTLKGYQEFRIKKNDTLTIVEYEPFSYNNVKAQRGFSYDFSFKIVNAYTNQVISTQIKTLQNTDAIEYQELSRGFKGSVSSLFPYNPQQTAPMAQYNPRAWRNLFSARNNLKPFDELKTEVYNQTVKLFVSSASSMK